MKVLLDLNSGLCNRQNHSVLYMPMHPVWFKCMGVGVITEVVHYSLLSGLYLQKNETSVLMKLMITH